MHRPLNSLNVFSKVHTSERFLDPVKALSGLIQSALISTSKSLICVSSGHSAHLCELIFPYQPSHSLRSSNQLLLNVPCANLTIGQRTFCHLSPSQYPSERLRPSVGPTFKRRPKCCCQAFQRCVWRSRLYFLTCVAHPNFSSFSEFP